jgi:hypothetical protein
MNTLGRVPLCRLCGKGENQPTRAHWAWAREARQQLSRSHNSARSKIIVNGIHEIRVHGLGPGRSKTSQALYLAAEIMERD